MECRYPNCHREGTTRALTLENGERRELPLCDEHFTDEWTEMGFTTEEA